MLCLKNHGMSSAHKAALAGIRCIIFDVGGVFRDSRRASAECFRLALLNWNPPNGVITQKIKVIISPSRERLNDQAVDRNADSDVFNDDLNVLPILLDEDELWHLRGLNSYNSLRSAMMAIIATKGQNFFHYYSSNDGETQLANIINNICHSEDIFTYTQRLLLSPSSLTSLCDTYKYFFESDCMKQKVIMFNYTESALERLHNVIYKNPMSGNYSRYFRLGILSNSTPGATSRDLGYLASFFDFCESNGEKPDPTVFLRLLNDHHVSVDECLYVGDAVSDATVAKRVGCRFAAVLSGMGTLDHLSSANPTIIVNDIEELSQFLAQSVLTCSDSQ